ncbi:MAG: hypothetical protein N3E50_09215, partial [Candidatus Goldbacteria bacterium]|nr:hypothetical protein [Candidatus Goldiibacteriota bacterium]
MRYFFFILFYFFFISLSFSEIILNVWNMPIEADRLQRQVWDEEVKQFEQTYNTIKIKGIAREYKPQEFVSVMASGKGPDIVRIPIA